MSVQARIAATVGGSRIVFSAAGHQIGRGIRTLSADVLTQRLGVAAHAQHPDRRHRQHAALFDRGFVQQVRPSAGRRKHGGGPAVGPVRACV
jgi:hypothetical protein